MRKVRAAIGRHPAVVGFLVLAIGASGGAVLNVQATNQVRRESRTRSAADRQLALHQIEATCAAINDSRRTTNEKTAALVKTFTIAAAEQPRPAQQPSKAVLDQYAIYAAPVPMLDCADFARHPEKYLPHP